MIPRYQLFSELNEVKNNAIAVRTNSNYVYIIYNQQCLDVECIFFYLIWKSKFELLFKAIFFNQSSWYCLLSGLWLSSIQMNGLDIFRYFINYTWYSFQHSNSVRLSVCLSATYHLYHATVHTVVFHRIQ